MVWAETTTTPNWNGSAWQEMWKCSRMNSSLVCTCQFQKAIVCTFKGYILNFDKSHEFYSACSELSLQKYHQSPMERDFSEPWMYGK